MKTGGGIEKETFTPLDDSVDAATVARWLNCSPRMVRQYAEEGARHPRRARAVRS